LGHQFLGGFCSILLAFLEHCVLLLEKLRHRTLIKYTINQRYLSFLLILFSRRLKENKLYLRYILPAFFSWSNAKANQ